MRPGAIGARRIIAQQRIADAAQSLASGKAAKEQAGKLASITHRNQEIKGLLQLEAVADLLDQLARDAKRQQSAAKKSKTDESG